MKLKDLDVAALIHLIEHYDEYIQTANNEDLYAQGWYPVCIEEFLNNEYLEITGEDI